MRTNAVKTRAHTAPAPSPHPWGFAIEEVQASVRGSGVPDSIRLLAEHDAPEPAGFWKLASEIVAIEREQERLPGGAVPKKHLLTSLQAQVGEISERIRFHENAGRKANPEMVSHLETLKREIVKLDAEVKEIPPVAFRDLRGERRGLEAEAQTLMLQLDSHRQPPEELVQARIALAGKQATLDAEIDAADRRRSEVASRLAQRRQSLADGLCRALTVFVAETLAGRLRTAIGDRGAIYEVEPRLVTEEIRSIYSVFTRACELAGAVGGTPQPTFDDLLGDASPALVRSLHAAWGLSTRSYAGIAG